MTKTPAPSNLARLDFYGLPPLLEGEDAAAYNELLMRISGAVKPTDVLEEIWVHDVVNLSWEVLRWHRLKANLITSTTYKGVEAILKLLIGANDADVLAKAWARRDADAVKEVKKQIKSAGLSMDAAVAQTVAIRLAEIERIDRMTMNAELRRNAVLREIDRHRQSFGQTLRRASDEIVDAQFEQVGGPQIEDRKAA